MVSFSDVGIAALLEYALVHLKLQNVLAHKYMRCGCIAAHKNGVKEKCITDWFCIGAEAKRNPEYPRLRMAACTSIT